MTIRNATYRDAPSIRLLLLALGYEATTSKLILMVQTTFIDKANELLVAVSGGYVVGFVAVHYLPQLGVDGDLALISYLVVDQDMQGKGIGKDLELEVTDRAKRRFCNRIELHCSVGREAAHGFYKEMGYVEYPTYFCKRLVEKSEF